MLLLAALPLVGLAGRAVAQSCAYTGGWALRNADDCPPLAPTRCGVGLQPRCCPAGQVCRGEGAYVGNYCCAPGEDCTQKAAEAPKCPDPSWSLWGVEGTLNSGGWCCLPSANGTFVRNSDGTVSVGCSGRTASLSRNQFWASPLSASTSCAPISASPTSASPTSASPTSTSSQSSTTSSSQPAQSAPQTPPQQESQGLGTGAIAGVAVGASLGGALITLLVVGIVIYMRRRRKTQQTTAGAETPVHMYGYADPKSPYSPYTVQSGVSGYQEMPHVNRPQELGNGAPTEMEDPNTFRNAGLGDHSHPPGR